MIQSEFLIPKTTFKYDIVILGQHHQPEVHYLREVLEKLKQRKETSAKFEFVVEFETQFNFIYNDLLQKNNDFIDYKGQTPIIYFRDLSVIIGNFNSFLSFITENFSYIEEKTVEDFEGMAMAKYQAILNNGVNYYAFLEVNDFIQKNGKDYSLFKDSSQRTIVLELYFQVCPRTVMNFLEICKESHKNKKGEKLSYKGCEIFRVVKNGYIQSGDLSQLSGPKSIYGEKFEDENFTIKHDVPGVLGSVKYRQQIHSNESQFYITLNSLKHFDDKFVAFGRVVKGFDVIKRMSLVDLYLQRPKQKIEIVKCGVFNG